MHEALFLDDWSERAEHGDAVIHLHPNFDCIENVARNTAAHSWKAAADKILDKMFHENKSN